MGQQSITAFFGASKRKAPPPKGRKERKVEPQLLNYALTSSAKFEPTAAKLERHQRFYDQIAGKKAKSGAGGRRAMKPYDKQFIELKEHHQDAVLMIQNGYKYQILGEDSYTAGRFLGRSPVAGWRTLHDSGDLEDALYDRFASLTFPIERLPFYVEKLVVQGLKVAVAKQRETSALKAQSSNKRGPFVREVTDVYTQGTLVEELSSASVVSGHLLVLKQTPSGFALLALQVATGSGFYDAFDDDKSVATELETRLLHILPSEILVVGDEITGVAARMIESLNVRIVKQRKNDSLECKRPDYIEKSSDLKDCWEVLQAYLAEFGLTHALELGLEPFTLQSFMYLSGDTLRSLEIFENQTTNETRGSLFWALDTTKTAFGRRLLRNWIGRPLLSREALAERVEAVEEIMAGGAIFDAVKSVLGKMPDLERYTLQTYHSRIAPRQLYWFLNRFQSFVTSVSPTEIAAAKLKSPFLQSIFETFEPVRVAIEPFMAQISPKGAQGNHNGVVDPAEYFKYKHGDVLSDDLQALLELDTEIRQCRQDFVDYVSKQAEELNLPIKQVFPIGEENTFVIGVPKSKSAQVPTSWSRQGAVSTEIRFWAPFSFEQTKKLKPLLEQQAIAAQQAYDNFVKQLADEHFTLFRQCVSKIASLDCLMSMAAVSSRPNYVKPDLVDGRCLELEDARHPVLEQLISSSLIPNSVAMHEHSNRVMIITGANMGGKSSYVRQVALLVIMAQIGYYVPAKRARLSLVDAVYTRMGASDNLMRGESTFLVELKECAAIMARATPRSLILMDEIGRGTSTMDGVAIADAVLQYVIEKVRAFTLFITHYPLLCEQATRHKAVENWSMDCAETPTEVTFLYKIVHHQASRSYGINVARLAGLPEQILQAAEQKSREFESEITFRRKASQLLLLVKDVLSGEEPAEQLMEETDAVSDSKWVRDSQL